MANEQIIVIDKIEEEEDNKGKTYLKITDKAGVTRNFKEGRSKLLTNKGHLLKEGAALKLHFEDYKAPSGQVFPFVRDFEVVEDVFVAQAAEKVQGQVRTERNDSIEAQVAQKGGIEILKALIEQALLTDEEIQECKEYAMSSVKWGMGRINLPSVIVEKIKEAKSEKTNTDTETTDQQQGEELTTGQTSREALEVLPKTVGEFLGWLVSHGKEYNRAWLKKEFSIPDGEILTIQRAIEMRNALKESRQW